MRRTILFALLISLFLPTAAGAGRRAKKKKKAKPPAAASADKLECTDPATDEKLTISVKASKKSLKSLPKQMKKLQVHILDLSEDSQERRRALPRAIAAADWCTIGTHLRNIADDLGVTRVEQTFVSEKFSRVELWLRSGELDEEVRKEVGRKLANVGVELSEGDPKKANKMLNACITSMFGGTLWDVPDTLPKPEEIAEGAGRAEIKSFEVEEACPKLAKKGRGKRDDLQKVERKLRKVMDERRVRVADLDGGAALLADMRSYKSLEANWPAIRVICVMLLRAQQAEIDLGFVMGRFHRITKVRKEREMDDETTKAFRLLVRAASESISNKEFAAAHEQLEEVLIFLGESKKPSASLDR